MSDEKICPIMSRPIMMTKYCDLGDNTHSEETEAMFKDVPCQRERCMAWNREQFVLQGELSDGGYCKLIERQL